MSSDEDDDYMSDTFLAKCADVRPGLKRAHAKIKKHEMAKKVTTKKKSKSELECEKREEGLNKALDESNRGFSMMAKMGFKMGQSLGKTSEGRKEPIEVKVKVDRAGLGREAVRTEIAELRKRKQSKKKVINITEFREKLSQQRRSHLVNCDLAKSQRICEELDKAKSVESALEIWFWPKIIAEDEEEEEEECEFEPEEQLSIITNYLRAEYLYCLWCGHSFKDQSDFAGCPGPTRFDHDD